MQKRLWQRLLLLSGCIGCSIILSSCMTFGKNTIYLTDKDRIFVVPRGSSVPVIMDDGKGDKATTIKVEEDMIMLYPGTYLKLQKEANSNLLK